MDSNSKQLGESGQQIVTGAGPHTIDAGYAAYCCKPRVDDTKIMSVTYSEATGKTKTAVTNKSWEDLALKVGVDFINFSDPVASEPNESITSITLNAATDSLILYLVPLRKE